MATLALRYKLVPNGRSNFFAKTKLSTNTIHNSTIFPRPQLTLAIRSNQTNPWAASLPINKRFFSTESAELAKANQLLDSASSGLTTQEYFPSIQKYSEALEIFNKLNDLEGAFKCYEGLAYASTVSRVNDMALNYAKKCVEIAEKLKNDDYSLKAHQAIGVAYNNNKDPTNGIKHMKSAISLAEKLGKRKLLANLYCNLAVAYSLDELSDAAIRYFNEYLSISRELKDIGNELKALYFIAQEYGKQGFDANAIEYWKQTLQAAQNTGNKQLMFRTYFSLARSHLNLGHFNDAADNFKKANNMAKDEKDIPASIQALQGLAFCYIASNNSTEGLRVNKELVDIARRNGYKKAEFQGIINLTNIAIDMNEFSVAESNNATALELAESDKDLEGQAAAHMTFGILNLKKESLQQSKLSFETALKFARDIQHHQLCRSILSYLGQVYNKLQEWEHASKYLHEAMQLHEGFKDDKATLDTLFKLLETYRGWNKPNDAKVYLTSAFVLAKKMKDKGQLNDMPAVFQKLEEIAGNLEAK